IGALGRSILARSISARDQISSAPSVSAEPIEQQSGGRSIPRNRPRCRIGASLGDPWRDLWRDRGRRSWAVGAKGLMPELRNANERRSPDSGVLLPILFRLRRKHSAHTGCVPCVYLSFDDRCGGRLRVNEDALLILSF